ncbi:MAG TPA: ABC transporter permease, partial [Roseiarcus sp.]|nr:ABC transporter permease [Roseiarcus sp.]
MSSARSDFGGLYGAAQMRRNRGLAPLFIVVAVFVAAYAYLSPGLLTIGGVSKFAQSWLPLALVSMAQATLMLTGGISLAIGPLVSLGAVVAATTMSGPLGAAGSIALVALIGLGVGLISGAIVVRLRLPAIVVTLAASFIIGGAALIVLPRPGGAIPAWFSDALAGNTPAALILLVLTLV